LRPVWSPRCARTLRSTGSPSSSERAIAAQIDFDTDSIVIGFGFGGSVSAMRLAEKGDRVRIMGRGEHFRTEREMPRSSWDRRRYLEAPRLGLRGSSGSPSPSRSSS
jgi:choline dehydrogenase-like flavoprotein